MKSFDLIIRPVITEKATALEKEGKYLFFVRKESNKVEIRRAFEKMYGEEVKKVNMMRTPGKTRSGRSRRVTVKKTPLKKVIITTKGKKAVDLMKPKFK